MKYRIISFHYEFEYIYNMLKFVIKLLISMQLKFEMGNEIPF